PFRIGEIPIECLCESAFKSLVCIPAERHFCMRGIDSVVSIMSGPIHHRSDLLCVGLPVVPWTARIQESSHHAGEVEVTYLAAPAEKVSLAGLTMLQCRHQPTHVVFDVEPVAYVDAS